LQSQAVVKSGQLQTSSRLLRSTEKRIKNSLIVHMPLLDYTIKWTKGEISQGRIMIVIGLLLLIANYLIWKKGDGLLKGMFIPLLVVNLILLGYGGYIIVSRASRLEELTVSFKQNPDRTLKQERERLLREKKAYPKFKIAWVVVIAVACVFCLLTIQPFSKGVALGILLFGITALLIDSFLENRGKIYLENIGTLYGVNK
jgi:hypothetical protein